MASGGQFAVSPDNYERRGQAAEVLGVNTRGMRVSWQRGSANRD